MWRNPLFWVVIVFLILLLFGGKRLPDLASSVGQSLKIFKKEVSELQDDHNETPPAGTNYSANPHIPNQTSGPIPPTTSAPETPTGNSPHEQNPPTT